MKLYLTNPNCEKTVKFFKELLSPKEIKGIKNMNDSFNFKRDLLIINSKFDYKNHRLNSQFKTISFDPDAIEYLSKGTFEIYKLKEVNSLTLIDRNLQKHNIELIPNCINTLTNYKYKVLLFNNNFCEGEFKNEINGRKIPKYDEFVEIYGIKFSNRLLFTFNLIESTSSKKMLEYLKELTLNLFENEN